MGDVSQRWQRTAVDIHKYRQLVASTRSVRSPDIESEAVLGFIFDVVIRVPDTERPA